jgi:hypothetical protein
MPNQQIFKGEIMKINPMVFYQNLSKSDKTKFLAYVFRKEGLSPITLSGKLRENPISHLRYEEGKALEKIIETEEWK